MPLPAGCSIKISSDDDGSDDAGEAIKGIGDDLAAIYLVSSVEERVREVIGSAVTF